MKSPTTWGALTLVATAVAFVAAAAMWDVPRRAHAGLLSLACLALAFAFIGMAMQNNFRGVLIDDRNMMSLSRLQITLWTLVIVSAYLTSAMSNVMALLREGPAAPAAAPAPAIAPTPKPAPGPLIIAIPSAVWLLLGISVTSWVGSPSILNAKKSQLAADDQAAVAIAAQRERAPRQFAPAPGPAPAAPAATASFAVQGVVLTKTDPHLASLSDMFRGEEVGNAATIDLGKLQLFFFTLIVATVYAVSLYARLLAAGPVREFPDLDSSIVTLLGISNAGYLANKAVPHSKPAA